MSKKTLAALALITFSGAALAAPAFTDVDADQDGKISAEEAAAAGMDMNAADANQDGSVDEAEFKAATGQ